MKANSSIFVVISMILFCPIRTNAVDHFQNGDRIALETEGLGRLQIHIRDDLKRVWSRETRLERQEQGFDTPTPQIEGKYTPA